MRNVNVKIESDEIMRDSLAKIAVICDVLSVVSISGVMTNTSMTLDIVKGYPIDRNTMQIYGVWSELTETMDATIYENGKAGNSFNCHPLNSMGGLDIKAFESEFKKAVTPSKAFTSIQEQLPFLATAVKEIAKNWYELNDKESGLMTENYPFAESFDEIAIKIQHWCNTQLRG